MNKRIFIALNFDIRFLENDLAEIKKQLPDKNIKWVEIRNIHLTLLFIGATPIKKIKYIEEAIEKNIKTLFPFEIELNSLGDFGRVLWIDAKIGEKGFKALKFFQQKLKDELRRNFALKEQKFVPHITIARIKGEVDRERFKNLVAKYKNHSFGRIIIDSVDIMESQLTSNGPIYKILRKYKLQNTVAKITNKFLNPNF